MLREEVKLLLILNLLSVITQLIYYQKESQPHIFAGGSIKFLLYYYKIKYLKKNRC